MILNSVFLNFEIISAELVLKKIIRPNCKQTDSPTDSKLTASQYNRLKK